MIIRARACDDNNNNNNYYYRRWLITFGDGVVIVVLDFHAAQQVVKERWRCQTRTPVAIVSRARDTCDGVPSYRAGVDKNARHYVRRRVSHPKKTNVPGDRCTIHV